MQVAQICLGLDQGHCSCSIVIAPFICYLAIQCQDGHVEICIQIPFVYLQACCVKVRAVPVVIFTVCFSF